MWNGFFYIPLMPVMAKYIYYIRFSMLLSFMLAVTVVMASNRDKGDALLQQADSLYAAQQYKHALDAASTALPLCKGSDLEADCLNLLAVINIRLSNYEEAAKYAKLCYALDEKSGDPDVMSSSLNTLAAIYMAAKQANEAEKYILKGIEMAEKANNPSRMAVLQAMASEVYHTQGDDQKALKYIEKAYEIDKQLGNEDRMMVRLAQKASVLIGLHNYSEGEQILKKVIPFLRKTSNRQSLGISLNKMGMALFSQHREKEAVAYYQEAADIFHQLGDPYNEVHARRGLYESLWKVNPDEAKRQFDLFNDLKDSIYTHVSAEKLAKYNADFGNDWLKIENHEQRRAKLFAIIAAIIAVLIAIVVWLFMRYRQERQIRINAELSERIKELSEKYDLLNEQYGNALATGNNNDDEELDATDNEFLAKTVNVINELILTGQIDANHVAERLGLSLFQFRQRLAALTDETPQSFIQTIRMRRARHLLDKHPEMNVSEVAMLCAYNDTPNFTRAFKRTFGLTPTQYLEHQQH